MFTGSEEAFQHLQNEIELILEAIKKQGAKAFQDGDYKNAKTIMNKAEEIERLRVSLREIISDWNRIIDTPHIKSKEPKKKIVGKKLTKGLRTHEDLYRAPILQALVELGGSSDLQPVINRVGEIMKPILNDYDYMTLKSDPDTPKWRNTTQWVRYTLVKEGYMASDSQVGIWEITEKGRNYLEKQNQ